MSKTYPCDVSDVCPFEATGLSCSDACGLGRDDGDELPDEAWYEENDPAPYGGYLWGSTER